MRLAGLYLAMTLLIVCIGSNAAQEKIREKDAITLKAKHYRTTGPCIDLGGGALGMPIIDGFEIVQVVSGSLPKSVKKLEVRALSGDVGKLKEGETCVVTLNPSADIKSQFQDRAKDGYSWLWVNASELKVQSKAK